MRLHLYYGIYAAPRFSCSRTYTCIHVCSYLVGYVGAGGRYITPVLRQLALVVLSIEQLKLSSNLIVIL